MFFLDGLPGRGCSEEHSVLHGRRKTGDKQYQDREG